MAFPSARSAPSLVVRPHPVLRAACALFGVGWLAVDLWSISAVSQPIDARVVSVLAIPIGVAFVGIARRERVEVVGDRVRVVGFVTTTEVPRRSIRAVAGEALKGKRALPRLVLRPDGPPPSRVVTLFGWRRERRPTRAQVIRLPELLGAGRVADGLQLAWLDRHGRPRGRHGHGPRNLRR